MPMQATSTQQTILAINVLCSVHLGYDSETDQKFLVNNKIHNLESTYMIHLFLECGENSSVKSHGL